MSDRQELFKRLAELDSAESVIHQLDQAFLNITSSNESDLEAFKSAMWGFKSAAELLEKHWEGRQSDIFRPIFIKLLFRHAYQPYLYAHCYNNRHENHVDKLERKFLEHCSSTYRATMDA